MLLVHMESPPPPTSYGLRPVTPSGNGERGRTEGGIVEPAALGFSPSHPRERHRRETWKGMDC
jgi:hypothetical protein